jgi:hypothetical protein
MVMTATATPRPVAPAGRRRVAHDRVHQGPQGLAGASAGGGAAEVVTFGHHPARGVTSPLPGPPGARWSAFSSDPYFGCPRGWRVARPRMTGNVAISFYCPGIPCSSCSMICLITAEIGAPFASMLTLPNSGFCPPPALGAGKHLFLQIPLSPRAAAQAPGHAIVQSGPALHVTAFAVAMGPSIPVATSTAST